MIDLPTYPAQRAIAWTPVDFGGTQKGPLGGRAQRLNRLGNRWSATVTMPRMLPADAELWAARLTRGLREGVRFAFLQPGIVTGSPGTVRVMGVGQAGTVLTCDGFNPGYRIRAGQFFSMTTFNQGFVHKAMAAQRAPADGIVALDIEPPLRIEPSDNSVIRFGVPTIEGLLIEAPSSGYDADRLGGGFSFTIEEAR